MTTVTLASARYKRTTAPWRLMWGDGGRTAARGLEYQFPLHRLVLGAHHQLTARIRPSRRLWDRLTCGMDDPVEALRKLCLALPETTERLSHGEPTWFVRGKKTFVTFADHRHNDRVGFWCAARRGCRKSWSRRSRSGSSARPMWVSRVAGGVSRHRGGLDGDRRDRRRRLPGVCAEEPGGSARQLIHPRAPRSRSAIGREPLAAPEQTRR